MTRSYREKLEKWNKIKTINSFVHNISFPIIFVNEARVDLVYLECYRIILTIITTFVLLISGVIGICFKGSFGGRAKFTQTLHGSCHLYQKVKTFIFTLISASETGLVIFLKLKWLFPWLLAADSLWKLYFNILPYYCIKENFPNINLCLRWRNESAGDLQNKWKLILHPGIQFLFYNIPGHL